MRQCNFGVTGGALWKNEGNGFAWVRTDFAGNMVQSCPVQRLKRLRTEFQLFYRKQKVDDAESDLIQLRNLYKGRKDIITPSVFSRLSPERQAEVLEEMLTAAREAGQRRAKIYRMLDNENSGERP